MIGFAPTSVHAVPNWNGASLFAEGRFVFPFWWEPLQLSFILTTDASVADRLVKVDLFGQESAVQYETTLRAAAGTAFVQTASTQRKIIMHRDLAESCENATLGIMQGQLFPFTVGPEQTFRISCVDLAAGDTVQSVRLHYRRLA